MRAFLTLVIATLSTFSLAADGDISRGARLYGACAACHSLELDKHMTGPSLALLWGRTAGGLKSFSRYSEALRSSGIVWEDNTLGAWLENPHAFIPGNDMTFPGIRDAQARADLLAFLKEAAKPGNARMAQMQDDRMGGMMSPRAPDLKKLSLAQRVEKIAYCRDTYRVTTADGKTRAYWEQNLRFKTDSGDEGPVKGAPAILSAGMMGDRSSVVFSGPEEMGQFVVREC